jgi:hypothetical protein
MTKDAHTPFGRENHQYTLLELRIRVWWSGAPLVDRQIPILWIFMLNMCAKEAETA